MHRLLAVLLLALASCGGGGDGNPAPQPSIPPTIIVAEISLLFMGNSHTSVNHLPAMVTTMVRAARPGKSVMSAEAPDWMFLEERAIHAPSLALLRERNWTYVVLQAQKYSSSGQFEYPTTGAEALIRMSRVQKSLPILFPEWPRLGIDETQRIFALHASIARKEPACVAPIPQAWDLALARYPTLVLHNADGNHSAPAGAYLAALIIANTMTGYAPDLLPYLPGFDVDEETQRKLRGVAAETVLVYRPREFCPADKDA